MSEEINKQLEALNEMFSSDGWKIFIEEVNDQLKAAKEYAPKDCPTNDLWQFRRGEVQKLEQISNYEELVKLQWEMLNVEDV